LAKSSSRLALLASAALALGGCTQLDNAIASVPYLAMMRNAPFFDPYEAPLPPPPGSIPYEGPAGEHMGPLDATDAALTAFAATPKGKNIYAHDDPTALAFGKKMYERNCLVCHGADAKGNGPIVGPGKFPMGPSLVASTRSEGYMYAIIRAGRGMMPSYGARVNHTERWAIITYVAHLRAQAGGSAAPAAGATAPAAGVPTAGAPAGSASPATTTGGTTPPAGQENR
jgi:mono/diheme cytochrome c family protein